MLKNEWKHLVKNKLMLVVVIAVITIPTIYTTLFLGSMWDPYGNVDKLPVAVVNNDKAVEYEGETLNVGQELVDQLAEDGSLDFRFVDAADAEQGLDDGSYYMVITIPENFSANASSLTSDAPEKMVLDYETNPGTNYIASKMSETAMKTIEASVRESVTKTYVQAVYDQIVVIGDGMQDAADGTGELQDGAVQLKDGNTTMTDGLQTLADSTLTFVNGSEELTEGLATYVDGVSTVNSGARTLNDGAQTLNDGAQTLNDGAQTLNSGAQTLNDGTQSAKDGSAALVSGTQQVDDNMTTLNAGLTQLYSATVTLPESTTALDNGVGSVQSGIGQLQAGNQQLQTGAQQLSGGAQQLDAGLAQIVGENNANSIALREGAAAVEQGINTMVDTMEDMVTSGNETLVNTANTVRTSANQIKSGLVATTDAENSVENAKQVLTTAVQEGRLSAEEVAAIQDALVQSLTGAKTNYTCGSAAVDGMNRIAAGLEDGQVRLDEETQTKIATLEQGASDLKDGITNYTNGVDQAAAGTSALVDGANQIYGGLTQSSAGLDQLADGTAQVKAGTSQLAASAPTLSGGIAQAQQGGVALQSQGTSALVSGAAQLYGGLTQLADGSSTLAVGTQSLAVGAKSLADGSATLAAGTTTLADGTKTLVSNNATLLGGANQLTDGAVQIADGSDQLLSGSKEIGDGLDELYDGTDTLKSSLSDAADEVKATNTSDAAVDLFSAPVDTTEDQMTTVENNGHAMAPYMMSVALWVGCIAFSLMYPLTEYYGGKLKSGISWWLSKASVLYLIAILQALCMLFCLHVFDGFNPARWGLTIAVAIAASLAFMSIMYFFTNFIGKAGSFLMLVFMVVQLAGSVGTYPLELSGSFVKYLHDWVPFTYTVKAFRSTIAGGESVESCILFMLVLFVVFSILSIMVFQGRARKIKAGKSTLHDWLDAHHLA